MHGNYSTMSSVTIHKTASQTVPQFLWVNEWTGPWAVVLAMSLVEFFCTHPLVICTSVREGEAKRKTQKMIKTD